jgi:hypothetical protein
MVKIVKMFLVGMARTMGVVFWTSLKHVDLDPWPTKGNLRVN